jgi:hypothetical protein
LQYQLEHFILVTGMDETTSGSTNPELRPDFDLSGAQLYHWFSWLQLAADHPTNPRITIR